MTGFAGFDALMDITPPSGTIARPTIGSGAATLQGTVALASNTVVKGVAITTSGATPGMTGSGGLTGVSVEQVAIATATGSALTLNNVGGTLSFSSISATGAATGIGLTNVSAPVTISGGTIQNTTTAGIALDGGAASFSFAGGIANSTGRSVLVHNRTGGARS